MAGICQPTAGRHRPAQRRYVLLGRVVVEGACVCGQQR